MEKLASFLQILGVNLVFLLLVLAVVVALAIWRRPAYAVLKRNFLAYFTSPIGYVFLCLFVSLTAVAAFWPENFFNANLANLDQLNRYLPWILVVFIPAITMSIWSEERRQGTDELLLTIPAADFDIVMGKYLAAVAIYTVSLIFSQFCNFIVLSTLGSPDPGLLLGNYLGYWMAGVAMLAIGMVASFLTNNLTVGFVLGALFNVPLVTAGYSDVLFGSRFGRILARWSISEQFADFQAGVVSFGSVLFFVMVAGVMFYLTLVLIGRRHWSGGRDGHSLGGHYLVRGLSLMLAVGAMCVLLARWDPLRADLTSEHLNSLHPKTVALLKKIKPKFPVRVDAYVSRDLPEAFVERRVDLANTLREFNALGHGNVDAVLHEVDLFSEDAARAKAEYGIEPREVYTEIHGVITRRNIIFGFGVRSGLERVTVPFVGQGNSIEQELVRAVVTVADATAAESKKGADAKSDEKSSKQPDGKDLAKSDEKPSGRKRLGVLVTDARLFGGGGSPFGGEEGADQPLIQELRRQYKVVRVDPSQPITERYDVLLAVQPSSLSNEGMKNFVDAVRSGQPTAIFEDPMPMLFPEVAGTSAPNMPPPGMAMFMPQPKPKSDMTPLWDLLGLRMKAATELRRTPTGMMADTYVAWQDFNPHEADTDKLGISHQWVFVGPGSGAKPAFSTKSPLVAGLQEVLMLYPGALEETGGNHTYTPLMRTGPGSGLLEWNKLVQLHPMGRMMPVAPEEVLRREKLTDKSTDGAVLAYRVQGDSASAPMPPDQPGKEAAPKDGGLNVIVVADIDVLGGVFFALRSMGEDPRNPIAQWNLDNVPLVLNIIDLLSGDDRFMAIRKRRPRHRDLTAITALTEKAKADRRKARLVTDDRFDNAQKKAQEQLEAKRKELMARPDMDESAKGQEFEVAFTDLSQRLEEAKAKQERDREEEYRKIERELSGRVQFVQNRYKILAVVLPPLLPLAIALCVFIVRRSHEGEGVSRDRIV